MPRKLKPCPFCGGEAVVVPGMFLVVNYKVICDHSKNKCAVGPQTRWYTTKAEAVAAWNSRAENRRKENKMSAEPSPRPWQVRYGDTVADATGAKVAACWRPENAALIADAVNHIGEIRQVAKDTAEAYRRLFRENRILGEELAIRQDHIVIASNAEFRRRAIDKQVALSRKVAEAESERDDLRAERDRLKAGCADLWRAVKRIEADSRLALGKGPGVASSALHYVHTYASSAIRAAEKKGFAP